MYTILILTLVGATAGIISSTMLDEDAALFIIGLSAVVGLTCSLINANMPETKDVVATPAKYTNQTYYIDNSKHLYIQQNDTAKQFGGDISSKIEYKDSAKKPAIEFKTIKSAGDTDDWIPFKRKAVFKTSVSKVVLPKSDLTGKLTKVTVLNQAQLDASDLSLAN